MEVASNSEWTMLIELVKKDPRNIRIADGHPVVRLSAIEDEYNRILNKESQLSRAERNKFVTLYNAYNKEK